MLLAFARFYLRRNLANWRALRRVCRDALPKTERKTLTENGE